MSEPRPEAIEVELQRIMRTTTVWLATGVFAPILALTPLVSSGWRPMGLPVVAEFTWWLGAGVAALGLALLVWAACPVLGFTIERAYQQKVFSCRVGIVLNLGGMALAGLATLLTLP